MDDYRIQLAAFEGPLDLLMHLIEKNKIDIYDIPIAELTRQYMEHLNRMRELDMEIASSFLVMAATLLQIKSRMMLPQQSKEKETAEEDPRQELVARLLEYKKFQQVSELLQGQAVSEARFCAREPLDLPTHHVLADLPLSRLLAAFQAVLAVREELRLPDALVQPESFTVQEKMSELRQLLVRVPRCLYFSEAFTSGNRTELIVTFLALLELIRLGEVRVLQAGAYEEITMEQVRGRKQEESQHG
ncbi:MAG: segregation/condensation protein A [Selenomonadaceae bacterium]|jgi:segregation and condensation protein A|uniref:segregation and condensation protein A n=1 Tax=Selenomonas bovis TaxID=416586 RepID=UPI0004E0DF88|nr:segregation/condensation protein A [Selenomonas bovis]MCI6753240.1 segregation/condensation protein A [Selenomonas bovis]MDY6272459.1 segregation/condensation protein A [Selenomonadaceae bacterium]MDY6298818.1 segregation/condensation protein A [Selenomonadaceae bacterium]